MISKKDSGSKIDLEETQESVDEEPIVNINTQQEDKISDSTLSELDEPANYKEAMVSPEAAKWKEAMKSKIQSMYDNQVWNLVDTTLGLKTLGCKWIFKKKTYMDGKVYTYKTRLVTMGYTQTHGIDYEETFSTVAKIRSIRIMLAIVAFHDYEIWQMDANTTFLNEKLTEVVFMAQPKGSITYVITCTRHDVSFALSMVSQHQQNPGEGHWTAIKNILKHLRNAKDRFLVYGEEEELRVSGYCDASWKTDKDESRSHSSWVFLLNEGDVTWKSSKQYIVADFICESDYIAACEVSKEAIWRKNFIRDLGVFPTVQDPIEIFCDNESVVALYKESKDHRNSNHIERK
nr:retrovirus-related Pol polyprotein from transposon TNT 1-94 [Tanacetum cinerariifolium]